MTLLSRDVSHHLRPIMFGTHAALALFGGNVTFLQGLGSTTLRIGSRSECTLDTGRNLSGAMDATLRLVLNNEDGDRPEVPDVLVLVTRGLSDEKDAAIVQAKRLKSERIGIVTVGMTSTGVDQLREELQQISTDSGNVGKLMLTNLNIYSPVLTELLRAVCRNRVGATDQSLRLVDGSSNEGRLEVYIDEKWTTLCSVGWTPFNTEVACHQLGFSAGRNMYPTYGAAGMKPVLCSVLTILSSTLTPSATIGVRVAPALHIQFPYREYIAIGSSVCGGGRFIFSLPFFFKDEEDGGG